MDSIAHPDVIGKYSPEFIARFWAKVDRSGGPDACWPWLSRINNKGYGRVRFGTGQHTSYIIASRVAWELTYGLILGRLLVCHNCPGGDNPRCCNPRHCFLGTYSDNLMDRLRKQGKLKPAKLHVPRPRSPRRPTRLEQEAAQFTADQIHRIRRLAAGGLSIAYLARFFETTPSMIYAILDRQVWKSLPE